jgi:hypothetical protein
VRSRLVVCALGGERSAFELPESRWAPERGLISGGERSLYELAVAASCLGWDVELRGAINQAIFETMCFAAGAEPSVGLSPRRPERGEIVVVPEVVDHQLLATLRLSGAAGVMYLLAPPGLCGWSFLTGWKPPDPMTVAVETLGTALTFRAIHDFGITMWTNACGIAEAAERALVPIEWLGTGTPVPFPEPCLKSMDVVIVEENRWARPAQEVIDRLSGVSVLRVPRLDSVYSLSNAMNPGRILVWPSRIEGMSRIAREARAVGVVPVALDTSPFATPADHGDGVVLVGDLSEMEQEIRGLLDDRDRLEKLSVEGIESARAQADWGRFVERVAGALDAVAAPERPAAAGLDAVGRSCWGEARSHLDSLAQLEKQVRDLEAHSERLQQTVGELTQEVSRTEILKTQLHHTNEELLAARRLAAAYEARFLVRLMNRRRIARVYRPLRWLAYVVRLNARSGEIG